MRLLPLLFARLVAASPALALEPQLADGDWDCMLGEIDLTAIGSCVRPAP